MSYNTPVRTLQGGSVLEVVSGGTINVNGGQLLLNGTAGRWAFGTAAISGGVGTIATGLSAVYGASANPALDAVGTFGGVTINYSLAGAGSIILYPVAGTTVVAGGRVSWTAFGV